MSIEQCGASPIIFNTQDALVGIDQSVGCTLNIQNTKDDKRVQTLISPIMRFHIIGYILFGASNTLVYKYQNTTTINGLYFTHPFIQTVIMFLGMHVPLYWYLYQIKMGTLNMEYSPQKKNLKTIKDYLHIWVPAICDFVASTLQFTALNFIDSSVYQMLRGGTIIFTSLFSKWLFKRKFLGYKYAGIGQVVVGLVIVGMSNFIYTEDNDANDSSLKLMAIILLIISMIFNGFLYAYEEWIYSNYNVHPTQLVGLEGLYGLIIYAIFLPILNTTDCPFPNNKGCVEIRFYNSDGSFISDFKMESVQLFFEQIGSDNALLIFIILGFFTVSIYNVNGLSTTKLFSGLTRSIIDVLRTFIIWIVGLAVTLNGTRQWETLDYRSNLLKILGFLFIVVGNLVYNGLIKLPYLQRENDLNRRFKISADIDNESLQLQLPDMARLNSLRIRSTQILSQQSQTVQEIHQQYMQFQLQRQQQSQLMQQLTSQTLQRENSNENEQQLQQAKNNQ